MIIHTDKARKLGLSEPKSFETQYAYVLRLMLEGVTLDTRICRFLGIHNLHSIVPKLYDNGVEFTQYQGLTECPFTGEIPRRPVIVIYMTPEQRKAYFEGLSALATQ